MPAAKTVLERLRQVPMIQGDERLDAVRQQFIQQPVIEIEALGIWRIRSIRKYPRPRDRKSIGPYPQFLDQPNVFFVPMIVVVGTVSIAMIADLARCMSKGIPDRTTPAVFTDGAFDLKRGSGGAPYEAARETGRDVPVGCLFRFDVFRLRGRRRHSERGKTRKLGKMPTRELTEHQPLLSG